MAEPIRDGDVLPMVGGPLDGSTYAVEMLLPFLNGGIPPGGVTFSSHFYELDQGSRRWVYRGKQEGEVQA